MSVRPDTVARLSSAVLRPRVAGRGYSRFVSLAKRILPAAAATLLMLVAVWPRLQEALEKVHIPLPRLDLREAQDLRMVNARFTGVDRLNRPYVVTAEAARQNINADDLVSLEGPKGDMTTETGSWFEVMSYTGIYKPEHQLLDLFGEVQLFQDKGNEFHTDSAHVDMSDGSGWGDEPIEGRGPFGRVTGEGFRIADHGDTIIFTGHAHLELVPRNKETP